MVVKTDVCAFSEFRIYPGHGINFVRKDGQVLTLINSKARHLLRQRKKPAKLTWTVGWRRLNKKDKKDEGTRTRRRRVQKRPKAIVGTTLEELKKKKSEKPSVRSAAREAAKAEIKQRQQKKAAKGKK
mmetsp:Transcript_22451/g.42071  ORF Transcript_22451/g.42071 Transcript_22451/m.42071 type:complete len:128 (+) Transcript_22451:141-524(+)|eukprot:CAMPEP_0184525662 /NCGR_PEP_ID=MMETSP0198_2-20121128/10230_1 /TAXON_ID=1112570 /ORGANISM="Thraustochytrium sp., Strain LLF1b" /LENGTH=127 /DNA_ID=CAMNT_0026917161 /DNA_START=54 /DNA_END=437 /DNA_ORIENTATION=+